ncbi:MAG: hypothetical protein DI613_01605 [Kocuria rhizophila]|nr:MAG: hypothetical protein DI613_01605 [Kocuria rhizophila]
MFKYRTPKHAAPKRKSSNRLLTSATAACIMLGGLTATAPANAAPNDIVSVSQSTRAADAQNMLNQINAHRASKGLAPVKYSASLSGIAQGQSNRLVQQEVINHSNTFLTDPRAAGYNAVGEIHALSYRNSVTDLVQWWKGSNGHNKVLTDPKMKVIGIGLTHVDGSLSRTGSGWRLVGTVVSYGFPQGAGPKDVSTTVSGSLLGGVATQSNKKSPTYSTAPQKIGGFTVKGAIKARHSALGGTGVVGTPTMNERGGLINGGAYQSFRNSRGVGHKILWSPATGARAVVETGAIGNAWKKSGYERGWGYPTTDEYRVGTEVQQRFSNGYVAHWSSVTGRTWVTR